MDFLQDFFFQTQETNLKTFLKKYDEQNKTHYHITTNLQSARLHMLKKQFNGFLVSNTVTKIIEETPRIESKIAIIINSFISSVITKQIDDNFEEILQQLHRHNKKDFYTLLEYFSDRIWHKIDVYDEDHNFITRRKKLRQILTDRFLKDFDI